ncbi:MAG TPA: hypothetical protein VKS44_08295 [Candidatus Acidoferrales bacterium]|nr:hypothetical protein [Candidatus Acidoferrales bacterium]
MQSLKPSRMSFLALSEWVMVLPATVFLTAAALRQLQPRQYEPSHTSWLIFEWTMTHISQTSAAVLFMGLPAVAIILGCVVLLQNWREDQVLRDDVKLALGIFRQHAVIGLLTVATVLAGAILAAAVAHVIVG